MSFVNNLTGVVAPVVTGCIVGQTHSFDGAFPGAGVVLMAGILSYVAVLAGIMPLPCRLDDARSPGAGPAYRAGGRS